MPIAPAPPGVWDNDNDDEGFEDVVGGKDEGSRWAGAEGAWG